MKIRLDVIIIILGMLFSTVLYFAYPQKQVWEKDGEYYEPMTLKKLHAFNPENLVYIGNVAMTGPLGSDSYEIYRVMNPINWAPYILVAATILSFIIIHVLARLNDVKIPSYGF